MKEDEGSRVDFGIIGYTNQRKQHVSKASRSSHATEAYLPRFA